MNPNEHLPISSCHPACPGCGLSKFKVWRLPNWMVMHWILNPGLAFNEIVLGQRLPRESLECRNCELPLVQRSYIVCPHCSGMHPAARWSGRHAFRQWLGLVCPTCQSRIPCLWNVFSILILAVTSPLWYLPYRFYFRDRVVAPPPLQPAPSPILQPANRWKLFLRLSVFWGGFMWLLMTFIPEFLKVLRGQPMNYSSLATGAVLWTVGGLAFGGIMNCYHARKPTKQPAKD
jgi:hypothetical protein